ncbi:MAG: hypothetical protein A3B99_00650 [Candidatus Yanofskybacteria bacterium RIFCSPHIGHO2_02_FULL_44_12b]|uniref:HTH arsR-type domain-containing protein n=1 Tax=Candidatus Yanofskybacteria bacterium RIFCSPLOWO2_01_FULL_44_22 TaxID=1802697 RepID=A0A1F8GM42_9BACT|nr:MAG: hypothetical protein A2659_02180 [Candidatus Yanofskybacteria bacterium RIFCSPHIGHO2_01_FULL_44_24]OGN15988.1 MAG: hypothetical protein A3B99_00650 [Candidatus Yanofskybacteria bacterium RIFCSPHIGHO2_02_FULL_44_12b]OGN25499.1 MAG: hypothetical protein A2925_02095 [Candidatus Yanofskybacteria bacterium RIFCSPLOWO2_01_FULL_44_22]
MSKNSNPLSLDYLFGSRVRVKVLKFLFRNYPVNFGAKDLADRVSEPREAIRKEIKNLQKIGLVKKI